MTLELIQRDEVVNTLINVSNPLDLTIPAVDPNECVITVTNDSDGYSRNRYQLWPLRAHFLNNTTVRLARRSARSSLFTNATVEVHRYSTAVLKEEGEFQSDHSNGSNGGDLLVNLNNTFDPDHTFLSWMVTTADNSSYLDFFYFHVRLQPNGSQLRVRSNNSAATPFDCWICYQLIQVPELDVQWVEHTQLQSSFVGDYTFPLANHDPARTAYISLGALRGDDGYNWSNPNPVCEGVDATTGAFRCMNADELGLQEGWMQAITYPAAWAAQQHHSLVDLNYGTSFDSALIPFPSPVGDVGDVCIFSGYGQPSIPSQYPYNGLHDQYFTVYATSFRPVSTTHCRGLRGTDTDSIRPWTYPFSFMEVGTGPPPPTGTIVPSFHPRMRRV